MMRLPKKTEEYVAAVDEYLAQSLSGGPSRYAVVYDAANYSVRAGGKRLRPVLTLAFCEQLGGDAAQALPFAAAVEMVHCYSLIHDDLPCMDDDDMRRGKPACHIKFGEANALLAGDGLLTKAFETIAAADAWKDKPQTAVKAALILAKCAGMDGMIGGQVIDLESEGKTVSEETIHEMYALKTGALIRAACLLGAAAAGAGERETALAGAYGLALGLAFQLRDDILDVTGDEKTLGKPVGSDDAQQKVNFVSVHGVEKAAALCAEYTERALEILDQLHAGDFLRQLTAALTERTA